MPLALVTGGAGFIGSALVRELLEAGHAVRVLDDLSTGLRANLFEVSEHVEFVEGDVCDGATVARCMRGVDAVHHLAAIASVPRSVEDPLGADRVNVGGFLHVLEAARRAPGTRVVFASSSAVYGSAGPFPKREEHALRPESPYALHKRVGEDYAGLYAALYGVQAICLRLFNVYGPRQRPDSDYAAVIPAFLSALGAGRPLRIFGSGKQTRDFVFVEDVARAFRLAATVERNDGRGVLNVGTGRRHSLLDLVHHLSQVGGTETQVVHESERAGDVLDSWASIERTRDVLGWAPRFDLAEGLLRSWRAAAA